MRWFPVLLVGCSTGVDPKSDDTLTIPTDHPSTTSTPTDPSTVDPPLCDDLAPSPFAVDADDACLSAPVVGSFDPVTEWTWTDNPLNVGYHEVLVTPVVIELTDDDADGDIDRDDVPDIVFMTFEGMHYAGGGALTAISGGDGTTLWSALDFGGFHPRAIGGLAAADLDGDGRPEIVVPAIEGLLCVHADGGFAWLAPVIVDASAQPAVADLEGDGLGEVIVGRTVVEHDGAIRWTGTAGQGGTLHPASFAADLDGDGLLEVVAGNTVYEHDGQIRWTDGLTDGKPAVADFDGDGTPEIVRVYGGTVHLADGDDGAVRWIASLHDVGGGAPTVADFDGDGAPEVGVATQSLYTVIDGDGTELWSRPIDDSSSSGTSSSAFDFEGDGTLEVVYADQHTLWIFDGATGDVELEDDTHSSGTLHEYPVIADVDGDGSAEIVVASNDYAWGSSRGITVIGDRTSSWAPARPVWNQHAYSITNIDEDGRLPAVLVPSWTSWNSFRAADSGPPAPIPLADLTVGEPEACLDECAADRVWAWFPVSNGGAADAGSVTVALSRLDDAGPTAISELQVPTVPVGSGLWAGPVGLSAADFGTGGLSAEVRSDVGGECDEADNTWIWPSFPCR